MPDFEYRVIDPDGKMQVGVSVVADESACMEALRAKGFQIVDLRPAVAPEEVLPAGARRIRFAFEPFGVPQQSLVFFTRQFATTLTAGLPLLRALGTLLQQSSSQRLRRILTDVSTTIQQGTSLHDALARHKGTFNDLYLSMVRVGEASGSLDVTVRRLADVMEKDMALRRKVRSAMAYPIFVLAFSCFLVYALVAFLLPQFRPIFEGAGLNIRRDYPITQFLIDLSDLVTNPYVVGGVATLFVAMVVAYRLLGRTSAGRFAIDSAKFYFPFAHDMIQKAAIARFCRTFGVLIKSGVPLLESLHHVAGAAGNEMVSRSIMRVSRNIRGGSRISTTLAKIALFPPLLVQMVTVGEETATLDVMFERVAEYYEDELEAAITALTSLLEPAMVIFVGALVCFFVLGVLLPILGISSAYQNQM
ncbi:MAG: type II secretion system F family protein [Armatimonadetes bacterium]|nr:type II secretion system F family protein [Armatimonadota bacterium]